MKKKSSTSSRGNKAAIVATILAVPMISTPSEVYAQRGEKETKVQRADTKRSADTFIKFANLQHKVGSSSVSIIGVGDGHTIYQRPNGTKFYVDPETGDMKPVSDKHWIKMTTETTTAAHDMFLKLDGIKGESSIKLVGVDADGSVIHQRPDGTQFKVHTKTGHITLMK
jgi:hypothetical protein